MSLRRYAVRRLAIGAVQVLAVVTVVFLLVQALPGDAAVALAGDNPDPRRIGEIRAAMGLDRPALDRFGSWLWGLAHGDLGVSLVSGRPVVAFLLDGLGPTLVLAVLALVLLVPLSVLLGVVAALREGGVVDRITTAITVGLHSIPEFALAVVLIALFGVHLRWLPPTAVGADLLAQPAVLVLPLVVLLARPVCSISRLVRAGMIDALASDHVRHARRLGIGAQRIRFAHALPNALAPAVQQVARTTDWLLGGVIVVEAVFVVPGLGTILVDAVAARDLPVVQGLAVVFAVTTVLVNLVADLIGFRLAPRSVAIA
ncbi:peptide/nickel transport system permease protein [Saccharothrix tamanrassetensis]|uniref:Peptide/nickel transport system permease protein n=1 Tax=Saccharothrix tamanrassetensis TaxID=1051531 RepID=A0A841CLE7_9PSEU|nr:ABC transporter permease [Saccharothrix tamanrassetensis]MBB5956825.1 peptide/nickel transport system permease protein [Saccharothrix tamanrassetensis]